MGDHLPDLDPAGVALVNTLGGVHAEHLALPTPCQDWTVQDLIAHVDGLTQAFTAAADKDFGPWTDTDPQQQSRDLAPGWAARIPRTVETLVRAWRRPEAWTGQTRAGGVDLPGEVAGLVALNEVVLHGCDLARATGQGYDVDDATATAVRGFVSQIGDHEREAMFGPALPAPDDADALDHALALSGRDPRWEPSG